MSYSNDKTKLQDGARACSNSGKQPKTPGSRGCTLAISDHGTVVVTESGKVVSSDQNPELAGWENIVAIACGDSQVAGLKSDGTVVAAGPNDRGQCKVGSWKEIAAISCTEGATIGIKRDGTVVATADPISKRTRTWNRMVDVKSNNAFEVIGVREDGTVLITDQSKNKIVKNWQHILEVGIGNSHVIGLKADGTVVAGGDNEDGQCNVEDWRDITAVSCGRYHTAGLRSDGTVVAVGVNLDGQCNVEDWRDIVAISCGLFCTAGLRLDGTVVTTKKTKEPGQEQSARTGGITT